MSDKLSKNVKTIHLTIIVNDDKSDVYILQKIAEALDLTIGATDFSEQVFATGGWRGKLKHLQEGVI